MRLPPTMQYVGWASSSVFNFHLDHARRLVYWLINGFRSEVCIPFVVKNIFTRGLDAAPRFPVHAALKFNRAIANIH